MTPEQHAQLVQAKARLASGVIYPSADVYHADKAMVRELEAISRGKSPRETDPVGFWCGWQS